MRSSPLPEQLVTAAAAVVMISMSSMAHADDSEVAPGMRVVPDPALAVMRGKYVASTRQVVYFGVQMQSNWDVPNGTMLNAGANFTVNLTTSTPEVSFTPTAGYVPGGTAYEPTDTTGRTITSSGVANVSGVTQTVQLTGDYNSTKNVARITFLSDVPVDDALAGDITSASFEYNDGGVPMSGYSALDDNAAVVHLQVEGQGVTEQSIRGAILDSAGKGVSQTIVALGDRHRISNQLELGVVVRDASEQAVLQQNLGAAIGNLRGLTPNL